MMNISADASSDNLATPRTAGALALTCKQDPPSDALIEAAAQSPASARAGWCGRLDGWTPDRIRIFLHALSETGVVSDACRAAKMSRQSAYAFRNSARGRSFDVAWRACQLRGRHELADDLASRARYGCVDKIVRDGVVVAERHRHDNRLAMAVLTRLDRLAESELQCHEAPRIVSEELDAFIEEVCIGGASAAAFIRARAELPDDAFDEESIIARNDLHAQSSPSLLTQGDDTQGDDAVSGQEPSAALTEGDGGAPTDQPEPPQEDEAPFCLHPAFPPEKNEAFERLFRVLDEPDEDDRPADPPAAAHDRRSGRSRLARRFRRQEEPEAVEDEHIHPDWGINPYAWNAKVCDLLQKTGLNSEIDPDLVMLPTSHSWQQDMERAKAADEAAEASDEWQVSTLSTSSGADGSGLAVGDEAPESPTPNPEPPNPPDPPQEEKREWVLLDDGIACQTINGKLPPHVRHNVAPPPRWG